MKDDKMSGGIGVKDVNQDVLAVDMAVWCGLRVRSRGQFWRRLGSLSWTGWSVEDMRSD